MFTRYGASSSKMQPWRTPRRRGRPRTEDRSRRRITAKEAAEVAGETTNSYVVASTLRMSPLMAPLITCTSSALRSTSSVCFSSEGSTA